MSYIIPSFDSRTHSQTNRNDVSGTIFASKNINLDEEAYIKLAPTSYAFMTTADSADLDVADVINIGTAGFSSTNGTLWVLSDEVFVGDIDGTTISDITSHTNEPTPGDQNDMTYFNGSEVVSDGTDIKYLSSSNTWTSLGGLTITGSATTRLAVFEGQNGVMIGHGNRVDLVDTTWTLDDTLILPSVYSVSSMVSNGSVAYIGTRHNASGEARMFIWDGTGSSANESYGVENYEIASVKAYGSSVFLATADGRLLRFNGGGFDEIVVLPIYMDDYQWGSESSSNSTISHRGMAIDGNQIFLTVTSDLSDDKRYITNMPGGVWCFDPSVGLYHRNGPSKTTVDKFTIATSSVDTATDEITVSSAPLTGSPVLYDANAGTLLTGLVENTTYFAIKVDGTTIKLATTEANAIAGTAIDLSGTGNSSQYLMVYKTFDFGQQYVEDGQSVAVVGTSVYDNKYAGRLAFSAKVETEAIGTDTTVLCSHNAKLPNRGYFVTPKLYSTKKDDKFTEVHLKHSTLHTGDALVVKYRTSEKANYPHDLIRLTGGPTSELKGVWTDSDTFTTTQDLSDVVAGEEVEIVAGSGSGFMAHIESISEDGGTYTVNLDEEYIFATATDEFLFVVDNWKKLGVITSDSLDSGFRIDKVGGYLQMKVELRGVETKVVDLMINNQSYRSLI